MHTATDPSRESTGGAPGAPAAGAARDAAFAVAAGFLGWTMDAFDYFLVVLASPAIEKEFGVPHTTVAFSILLTLMFRPLGALVFGLMADRYGRRTPMMAALILYSTVSVATGFAPNIAVFLVLRAIFGIGMGGEWGVGASLVMEKVSPKWRGALSGLLQEGYAAGCLLAAVTAYFMLDRHGWRPMFFLGGLPALLALFVRFFIKESEVWQKSRAANWSELGRGIASNWKVFLYLTLLMTTLNLSSHGTQDNFPEFLNSFRGLSSKAYSKIMIVGMIGAIIGGVLFGLASDRFGRRKMMVLAFTGALVVVPLWAYSTTFAVITAGAFLMQFMVQGAWGIIPAHINELSPDRVRGFLPGFAYQCGNLASASIAWVQATLALHIAYPNVMAGTAAVIFICAIAATAAGRERKGIRFGET